MNPELELTMLKPSPYMEPTGGVDIKGICNLLSIDSSTLAETLGVSRQAASQQLNTDKRFIRPRLQRTRKFWNELNQVLSLLLTLVDKSHSKQEIERWFYTPNLAIQSQRPIDLVHRRKLAPLKKVLTDALMAAQGG